MDTVLQMVLGMIALANGNIETAQDGISRGEAYPGAVAFWTDSLAYWTNSLAYWNEKLKYERERIAKESYVCHDEVSCEEYYADERNAETLFMMMMEN